MLNGPEKPRSRPVRLKKVPKDHGPTGPTSKKDGPVGTAYFGPGIINQNHVTPDKSLATGFTRNFAEFCVTQNS